MKPIKTGKDQPEELPSAVSFDDFLAYSPEHKYIFRPTGTLWPVATVNARLPWIGGVKPSTILDRNASVEQMTWAPGQEEIIHDRLMVHAGWIDHLGAKGYNLYRPPEPCFGNPDNAKPWLDHLRTLYPREADHILPWLACRVQHPHVKINHALLLGGEPGIGKDTLLYPVIDAVGPWNCESVSPQQILGRFNGHLKSVLLLINEARDLGEINRPNFYEHMKGIIADSASQALRIDEKNRQEYYIPNLVGVIITTNHKAGGIYLSAEDRRHLVCWSPLEANQPSQQHFDELWEFYDNGGTADVTAYLHTFDLSNFHPKQPPFKTPAFWEIVSASRMSECDELADALDAMNRPTIVTLDDITSDATSKPEFNTVLRDRKNRRSIARWFEDCGYVAVHNQDHKQGIWKIRGKYQMVYGRKELALRDLHDLARART